MPSVAEQLRHGREKSGLSVHAVAEATKIRTDHIRALEEGNYTVFSAPIYIRGFVRTYASLLRLNVAQIVADLDAELRQTKRFSEPVSLTGRRRTLLDSSMLLLSRVNWVIVVIAVAIVAALGLSIWGIRAWQRHQSEDPLRELGPGLYQPARTNSGETLPLPRVPQRR
jgi:cytoskeleton protein RodZ